MRRSSLIPPVTMMSREFSSEKASVNIIRCQTIHSTQHTPLTVLRNPVIYCFLSNALAYGVLECKEIEVKGKLQCYVPFWARWQKASSICLRVEGEKIVELTTIQVRTPSSMRRDLPFLWPIWVAYHNITYGAFRNNGFPHLC
jgi:hypothetical protein